MRQRGGNTMSERKIKRLKKLHNLLGIGMRSVFGVFIGYTIYVYGQYRKYPGLYAMQSAPWYTGVQVCGLFTAAILLLAIILKYMIKKKLKSGSFPVE